MHKKSTILLGVLFALVILSGCTASEQPPEEPSSGEGRLNVVDVLGLETSVRIEIMEFDLEDVDPNAEYIPLANITNPEEVGEIIFLLDADLIETPAVLCIPEYRLRFWLEDGSQEELGFSCESAEFITGEQAVFAGRQFAPPGKFNRLIRSYFEQPSDVPGSINLLKAAEFGDVVSIEILEQSLGENSAEVNSVMLVEDIEVIEEILLAMSGEFTFQPQARCPVTHFMTFTMSDARTVTFGFMCDGDEAGILRGDQAYFFDQDIHLGPEFVTLFEELLGQ